MDKLGRFNNIKRGNTSDKEKVENSAAGEISNDQRCVAGVFVVFQSQRKNAPKY